MKSYISLLMWILICALGVHTPAANPPYVAAPTDPVVQAPQPDPAPKADLPEPAPLEDSDKPDTEPTNERKPFDPIDGSIFEPVPATPPTTDPQVVPPTDTPPTDPIPTTDPIPPTDPVPAINPEVPAEGFQAVLDFLHGHLEIGARYLTYELEDTHREPTEEDAYLGFINELTLVEDNDIRLFADILITPWVGVEITSSEIAAETTNYNNELSDGTLEMSGMMLSIQGRYPNQTRFTPYAGFGKADMDATFQEDTWWTLGYGSPEAWVDDGSPSTGGTPKTRSIEVTGDDTTFFYLGLLIRLTDYLSADLYYYELDLEAKATFTDTYEGEEFDTDEGIIPMSHSTLGFGLRYVF